MTLDQGNQKIWCIAEMVKIYGLVMMQNLPADTSSGNSLG